MTWKEGKKAPGVLGYCSQLYMRAITDASPPQGLPSIQSDLSILRKGNGGLGSCRSCSKLAAGLELDPRVAPSVGFLRLDHSFQARPILLLQAAGRQGCPRPHTKAS